MSNNTEISPEKQPPSEKERAWAREKVIDLLSGCAFNAKLVEAGICKKYLCEMFDPREVVEYSEIVEELFHLKNR